MPLGLCPCIIHEGIGISRQACNSTNDITILKDVGKGGEIIIRGIRWSGKVCSRNGDRDAHSFNKKIFSPLPP